MKVGYKIEVIEQCSSLTNRELMEYHKYEGLLNVARSTGVVHIRQKSSLAVIFP